MVKGDGNLNAMKMKKVKKAVDEQVATIPFILTLS